MKPRFHPQLVNDPFGDAGLFVDFLFEKRALIFDLGALDSLAPRKLLRLTHAFVSHAHMDHFMGFDWLLRIHLGREKRLHLFGPAGFVDQVAHKLAAYSWNLVHGYPDLVFTVTEVDAGGRTRSAVFRCRTGFERESADPAPLAEGVLLDEPTFRVRAAVLDHKIPCLAFALEEKMHVNVWTPRLAAMGLPTGPWLRELKEAAAAGEPDDRPFRVWWREGATRHERMMPLGVLKAHLLSVEPGQKIGYVVDAAYHEDNARRIVELVRGSDPLYIETPFLDEDAAHAAAKYHLTAGQAGRLAREAGVKRLVPFHFSPRYLGQDTRLRQEAQDAFLGRPCA